MKYAPTEIRDLNGGTIVLRSVEVSDAESLIPFMKTICAETPFLVREPDEFHMTMEQEEAFLDKCIKEERGVMLAAFWPDGTLIGTCQVAAIGAHRRYRHRCGIAIALYQKYWGAGIGKAMLVKLLQAAKDMGYEQAELEVVASNERAVRLYHSLGFVSYGRLPDNMKYADGSYADTLWMMKKL